MNLQLTDKIAIITGGTRGIGAGIARVLAAEGVHLALAYRSDTEGALSFTRELTEQYGIQAHAIKADVTIPEEVEALRKAVNFGLANISEEESGIEK